MMMANPRSSNSNSHLGVFSSSLDDGAGTSRTRRRQRQQDSLSLSATDGCDRADDDMKRDNFHHPSNKRQTVEEKTERTRTTASGSITVNNSNNTISASTMDIDDTWLELCEMDEDSISSFDAVLDGVGMNDCNNDLSRDQLDGEKMMVENRSLTLQTSYIINNNSSTETYQSSSSTTTSTTKPGGKSLDQLIQVALSSDDFLTPYESPKRSLPRRENSTTRRRGGKAMRLLSCHKRFRAQHRRHRSLAFRPLLDLPTEVLSLMLSFVDVPSLLAMRQLCRKSKDVSSRDDAGWTTHCERLWKSKVHVSQHAKQLQSQKGKAMEAYIDSVRDARQRQHINHNELCYHPVSHSGTVWSFRFKSAAGSAWTDIDPWHSGGEARQMVFLEDGTIKQLIYEPAGSSTPRLIPPFSDQQQQQQRQQTRQHQFPAGVGAAAGIAMTWRYVTQPLDSPARPQGSYIRVNVSGRDVPTYICQRTPKKFKNWGFVMDSLWGVFTSFELPRRRQVLRLRRTSAGTARWFNVDGMESDDSDGEDDDSNSCNTLGRLLSDSALPTTSKCQWREALMYNYGSRVLPEGEQARKEFDRLFIA
jgi:hypothetical protein